MDALALLCTLYAEGPVTLARLRAADCCTIERVTSLDANALAALLPGTEATALRFQREARNLGERLGNEAVEHALVRAPKTARQPALERVLAAWRERDARDAAHDVDLAADALADRGRSDRGSSDRHLSDHEHLDHPRSDRGRSDRSQRERADGRRDAGEPERETDVRVEILHPLAHASLDSGTSERSTNEPRGIQTGTSRRGTIEHAPAASGTKSPATNAPAVIASGAVDGLDVDAARALARAGVRDVQDLATCDALSVARASGLSWTHVTRLRALAGRSHARIPRAPTAREPATAVGQVAASNSPTPAPPAPAARSAAEGFTPAAPRKWSPAERPGPFADALIDFERGAELQPAVHEGAGGPFA